MLPFEFDAAADAAALPVGVSPFFPVSFSVPTPQARVSEREGRDKETQLCAPSLLIDPDNELERP